MVRFTHPGTPEGSFPDLLFRMIEECPLTIMVSGPYEPTYMVQQLRAAVPFFANSAALENGFAAHPGSESVWGMLDGELAAAVLLFVSPSDIEMMAGVIQQIATVTAFNRSIVRSGEFDPIIAHDLRGAHAFPAHLALTT
ncbi:hypothetical protein SAMN06295885_0709 [Rathayibacter oskolensis]|uniref:Uncharacterized protein n=1 Tax=Rathayibacter oskolensis TaxID=1891671 RepID=A0A1X7N6M6_9MICO|nr:hypothetical protein [Rathayibacter oskolensis]SMH32226.1 hypothetical protein SAMN06295885_0709 [Rathayibacter oskolensis]